MPQLQLGHATLDAFPSSKVEVIEIVLRIQSEADMGDQVYVRVAELFCPASELLCVFIVAIDADESASPDHDPYRFRDDIEILWVSMRDESSVEVRHTVNAILNGSAIDQARSIESVLSSFRDHARLSVPRAAAAVRS